MPNDGNCGASALPRGLATEPVVTANICHVAQGKRLRNDPERRMTNTAIAAHVHDDLWSDADLAALDRSQVESWVVELREAERSVRRLRKRLAALVDFEASAGTACDVCEAPMVGRSDRRYCSAACRQRAYRRR